MIEKIKCRLCGDSALFVFEKEILSRHKVKYYVCQSCGSLQTETPYWLGEAYAPLNEQFDTGQVIRSLDNAAFLYAVLTYLGLNNCYLVDYGCGSGLLVRLMRDVGFNAKGFDCYSLPRLSIGFHTKSLEGANVINLCEVAEHFDEPAKYFDQIFSSNPDLVIAQTVLFEELNPAWDYLAVDHGQHIFFYSKKAMEHLAKRHNMIVTILFGFIIFFRPNYLGILFNSNSPMISAGLQTALSEAKSNFMVQLLKNGYTYAAEDNIRLRSSGHQKIAE